MRGFFRKWGAVALALVLSLSVFAGMDGSSVQAAEDHAEDWMADIDGETMLSSISIPGTHDSATQYVGMRYIFQCQDTSIAQQLVDGYRYFDMRLVLDGKEDEQILILKHNFAKCKEGGGLFAKALKLSNVLSDVYAFLQEHPSETVILCMKAENSKDDVAQVQKLLYEQIDQNPQMWYLANEIPTLEQVRFWQHVLRMPWNLVSKRADCIFTGKTRETGRSWMCRMHSLPLVTVPLCGCRTAIIMTRPTNWMPLWMTWKIVRRRMIPFPLTLPRPVAAVR